MMMDHTEEVGLLINADGSIKTQKLDRRFLPLEVKRAGDLTIALRSRGPGWDGSVDLVKFCDQAPILVSSNQSTPAAAAVENNSNDSAKPQLPLCASGKRTWMAADVSRLIELVRANLCNLKDKRTAKKGVWDKIAKELGEEFDGSYCDQKWRNLKETFKNFEDNKKKTESAAKPAPAFYAELKEILSASHSINPLSTVDTLQPMNDDEDDVEKDEPSKKRKKQTKKKQKDAKTKSDEKLDLILERQQKAMEKEEERFRFMTVMWERQHAERLAVMKDLVNSFKK